MATIVISHVVGVVVNHAVVLAQLIVNGQRIGPQAFLVQIRDRETHQPLPGKMKTLH